MTPLPFIVGTGRCGTTLLRLMLDAHPEMAIPPETHFIPDLARKLLFSTDQRRCFVDFVSTFSTWADFGMDRDALRREIEEVAPFDLGEALRRFYALYALQRGKVRWGDKTPAYAECMTLIQRVLPEARFIHLVRDGRDVTLSIKNLWFGPDSVRESAEWWVRGIENTRAQARDLHHYLEIRYEDLVLQPEETLRSICEFIELPWDPSVLTYYESADERLNELTRFIHVPTRERVVRPEEVRQIHQLTQEKPQPSRIGRWRTEMEETDRDAFEEIAGALLRDLGYEAEHNGHLEVQDDPSRQLHWIEGLEQAVAGIKATVPGNQSFVLVDGDIWGADDSIGGRQRIAYSETGDGYVWPPENDAQAIRALERHREAGAAFAVFVWPVLWVLDYYHGFQQHLRARYCCVLENERIVVFDLRRA
jgi:hypothetical protein